MKKIVTLQSFALVVWQTMIGISFALPGHGLLRHFFLSPDPLSAIACQAPPP
jgi:hypothetical protein